MKEAVAVIVNPEVDVENKVIAFDNLEMLCEGLDNAVRILPHHTHTTRAPTDSIFV